MDRVSRPLLSFNTRLCPVVFDKYPFYAVFKDGKDKAEMNNNPACHKKGGV